MPTRLLAFRKDRVCSSNTTRKGLLLPTKLRPQQWRYAPVNGLAGVRLTSAIKRQLTETVHFEHHGLEIRLRATNVSGIMVFEGFAGEARHRYQYCGTRNPPRPWTESTGLTAAFCSARSFPTIRRHYGRHFQLSQTSSSSQLDLH
jgi:hypothetical protein